jgi:dienelactone hydrolase
VPLKDYVELDPPVEKSGMRHPVFFGGTGPGVIVLHEVFGLSPECIALGDRLVAEGYTVYLPVLFGTPGQSPGMLAGLVGAVRHVCMSREFRCLARNESSPVTVWLRALSGEVARRCGGRGVGAIGLCLTGGFVLSMMVEESVIAPVAGEPSLPAVSPWKPPFGLDRSFRSALGITPSELAQAKTRHRDGVPLMTLRYERDRICPAERIDRIEAEFPNVQRVDLASSDAKHATLTIDFNDAAYARVTAFLRGQLAREA